MVRAGFLFAATNLLVAVWARFEDEVGQYEWMVQQIGEPTALAYSADASNPARPQQDKVFVATASGVVASMWLKDGTLQWRRAGASEDGVRLLRAGSRALLSVTNRGMVQAWKATTGNLTWQMEYTDEVVDLFLAGPKGEKVVVVRESDVEAYTMAGKQEWSTPISKKGARYWAAAMGQDESVVCAVASTRGGAEASAMQIEVNGGKVAKTVEVPAEVAKSLEAKDFIVADAHVVFLSGDTLSAFPVCGEGPSETFELRKIKTKGGPSPEFWLMPWQQTSGVFAATNGQTTAIFGLSAKGLKHLRTIDGVAVVGPVYSVHDDEAGRPVAVAVARDEGTKIQLLDPASGNVQPAINAEGYTVADHGSVRLLLVRELGSGEHRTVISAADHSLAGVQGSKVAWVREEALARVTQASFYHRAHFVARPAKEDEGPNSVAVTIAAIVAQLSGLPEALLDLAKKPFEILMQITDFLTGAPRQRRTVQENHVLLPNAKAPASAEELRGFGADKLIIVATEASKLIALEATSSELVWQRYFPAEASCAGRKAAPSLGACSVWASLLPSSAAVHSELLVIAPMADGAKSQKIVWLDPLNGQELHQELAPDGASISSIIPLPKAARKATTTMHAFQPFVIIDNLRRMHVKPSGSEEAERLLQENAGRLFHYEVDRATQVVEGFALSGSGSSASKQLTRLWNLELGSVGEQIVASQTPEHRQWDHVPVHIKGDASILYKYINSNLLGVVSQDFTHKGNMSSLNLYVLDAVTGHVLHQSRIVGGATPVHMTVCDNWVLMHYWNQKRTRFEVTVTDFFEPRADDGPWNILFGKQGSNLTKSAHHLEMPVPLQQTYIFPHGITSMGVTATLKGITPRSIIMSLATDHIYRVSKDMLNPRRPYTTTGGTPIKDSSGVPAQFAPTKEEVLPVYKPVVPFVHTEVLSYYNPIRLTKGIASSPTALESTSLIFSYGLDLFFTPVRTAGTYDVLSPGFNYKLLYLSVIIVLATLAVTSYMASRRTLQDRWK